MRHGNTILHSIQAVNNGKLAESFDPATVNRFLGIGFAGAFLPKH